MPERRVTRFAIRIKAKEAVFYVWPEALREELDGLRYSGFGRWKGGPGHRAVAAGDLKAVQKDLRLHVCLPGGEICFCDLTQEEVSVDPFGILAEARSDDEVLWEFDPMLEAYKPATTPHQILDAHASAWEQALFD